jgi:NADPH:quinone reductase-like Zn-dependent oxidoreductase
MKALVLHDKNQPITQEELPEPAPGREDVIVKLYSAALNHRDVWIQKGLYAGLKYPIVPGSDGSGVVSSTGGNVNAHWRGREVIINPSLNWGMESTYQDPGNFKILGLPDDGTFAQYVKVPSANLVDKPSHLSFEEAAALPLAGLTAFRGLFTRAGLRAGEKILITGIGGGVALFALQFAVAAGAVVFVNSGSEEKIARAISLGAKAGVNYKEKNWADRLQEQAGSFHIIMDGTAGDSVGHLLNLASPGGRIVFYGSTLGNALTVEIRRIFWKQLNILGTTMGSSSDFLSMIDMVNKHRIRPVTDKIFPLAEGEKALRRMEDAQQFGKIILRIS